MTARNWIPKRYVNSLLTLNLLQVRNSVILLTYDMISNLMLCLAFSYSVDWSVRYSHAESCLHIHDTHAI